LTRVLVVGVGVTGEAVAGELAAGGDDVTVIEDAPRPRASEYRARVERLADVGVQLVEAPLPATIAEHLHWAELVVPSPGVPERHLALVEARVHGVPIRSEIDLAAERAPMPIVAVTGTNGKTTVTGLIAAMLHESGVRVTAGGNIGRPLIEAVHDDVDVVVAEVSSFQLRFTTESFRPRVAVLLNVAPDHLDWHGSFDAYVAAKARVFANQTGDDLLVYNAGDPIARDLAETAPSRTVGYEVHVDDAVEKPWTVHGKGHSRFTDDARVAEMMRARWRVGDLPFPTPMDRENAIAATETVLDLGVDTDAIVRALQDFARLPHRVELVGKAGGVAYYDDSKATNPHATLHGLEGFDSAVLIAGGRNKGLDLGVLRSAAPRLRAVIAIGEAAPDIEAAFAGVVSVEPAASMHDAVRAAAARAEPGDVVLLSPACASFDWYANYADRGDDFAREVARLEEHA
jgi:UDP-N-acetylmuramoylalanine--D-glutamate ligase